jgi:DNA-binding NarL/FixJ family response regulator
MILTGYPEPEKVFRAIKAGAIGYLLKVSTWEQLLQAI